MGGVVPLGYRVEARKLHGRRGRSRARVRLIFQRYLDLGSLPALQRDLLAKRRQHPSSASSTSGRTIGGVVLTNGPLSHLLKNRVYRGEIKPQGAGAIPSDHPAIVDAALFDAVQGPAGREPQPLGSAQGQDGCALLTGRIADASGIPMSPSHTPPRRVCATATTCRRPWCRDGSERRRFRSNGLPAHEVETICDGSAARSACGSMRPRRAE